MRFRPDQQNHALLFTPVVLSTLALAAAGLAGCDKLTPNGASGTIAMLHAGSEQVCVAPEVQDDLRGLILPKPNELGADVPTDDALSAIGSVSLTFAATTLQSTDKTVNKATCTTNVQLGGIDGDQRHFRITYDVSPSAEDPNHVVVTADTDNARVYARSAIDNAVAHQNAAKAQQQQAAQADQAHQQLLATVTPRWLVGSWILTGADAAQCSNGQAYTFRANHRVDGTELSGRWVLTQDRLHAIGQGMSGAAEIDGMITAADPLSFTLTTKDGAALPLRRCTREELGSPAGPALPDSYAPAPAQTPQN